MKINVREVGDPWTPPGGKSPMWSIMIENYGEPQKTFDAALAVIGEHEAEQFTSKSGKTFWRVPKASQTSFKAPERQFKADPDSRDSIEKQKALAEAVNFVNGMIEKQTEAARLDYTLLVARKFYEFIQNPSNVTATLDTDLPPITLYDDVA